MVGWSFVPFTLVESHSFCVEVRAVKIYEDCMLTVKLSSSEKGVQLRTVLLSLLRLVNEIRCGGMHAGAVTSRAPQRVQWEQSVRIWTVAQRWTQSILPGQRLNPGLPLS
jgi:hypothetical protein